MNKSTKVRLVKLNAKLSKVVEFADGADNHTVRRLILGNPISAAISAKKGQKGRAFGDAYGNAVTKEIHDGAVGAGIGALAGAAIPTKYRLGVSRGKMALTGAAAGAAGGLVVGAVRGTFGRDADAIHRQYADKKNNFSMNKSTKVRLVKLNAKLSQHVEFAQYPRNEEDHTLRNTAIGAGVLAAGAGGLYLRGRKAIKDSNLPVGEGGRPGIFDTMKVGGTALGNDAKMAYTGASAGVRQGINATKTAGGQMLAKGKGALADVAVKSKAVAASVLDASKKALLKGQGHLALMRS